MSQLPGHWAAAPLKDVAPEVKGSLSPAAGTEYELWSVPAFADGCPEAVDGSVVGSAKRPVQPDDVLICKINPRINRVWQVGRHRGRHQVASLEWITVRPRSVGAIEPSFLRYYLSSPDFRRWISTEVSGVTGSHTRAKPTRVMAHSVPLPPIGEQLRIVEILEDHLSRLDAAADYAAAASKRLVNLHESTLRAALAPYEVELLPLSALLATPLTNGRSVPTRDDGFPVLRLTALTTRGVDLQERKSGAWTASEARRFLVSEGDFLIARGNGSIRLVGRGSLVRHRPDPVAFPDTIIRVRPNPDILGADYLDHVWNSHGTRRQIESMARTTAGIYKVNQKQLGLVQLPVPSSLDVQSTVAAAVNSSREAVDAIAKSLESAERRSLALRRAVLAAAFSGKLTGRHRDNDVIEDLVGVLPSWSGATMTA